MTTTSTAAVSPRLHPYPTIRRGGVLVLILGVSMIFGTAVDAYAFYYRVFFTGIVAAVLAFIFFKQRYLYGKPTPLQTGAIYAALILGVLLLAGLFVFVPDYGSRAFLLLLILIIGIDFIPLSIAVGPLMLILAVLCILDAVLGLWLQGLSFTIFTGVDGVLKIIFGILMLRTRPVHLDTREVRRSA
jgi:hypothetical protein